MDAAAAQFKSQTKGWTGERKIRGKKVVDRFQQRPVRGMEVAGGTQTDTKTKNERNKPATQTLLAELAGRGARASKF